MSNKKRERLEVIRDILNSIRQTREIKPTRLLYSSNLSPQMFKDYIDELIKKDFIKLEVTEEKRFFTITKKGNDFLQQYKMIESFVSNFGL